MKKSLFAIGILLFGIASAHSQSISPAMKELLEQRAKNPLAKARPEPADIPIKLSAKMRHGIETDLRDGLKDPESGRFGMMNAARHSDGTISICGWVNAKNSYGGYEGEMPFTAIYSIKTARAVMERVDIYRHIQPVCLENGVSLEPNTMSSFPSK